MDKNKNNKSNNSKIISPGKLRRQAFYANKLAVFGLIVFVIIVIFVIVGPNFTGHERDTMNFANENLSPLENKSHLFGTDEDGRDFLTRIMYGGRLSLGVAVSAVVMEIIIAIFVGGFAGYFGGMIDNLLMRFTEIVMSIPFIPLIITISAVTMDLVEGEDRLILVAVILGALMWPQLARLIRGEILSLKEQGGIGACCL